MKRAHPAPAPGRAEDFAAGAFFLALLLVFDPGIRDHFALPKLVALQAGTLALWLFMASRCLRDRCRRLPRAVVACAAGLAAWSVLSTFTAVHTPSALWGNYGRYQGLWTQLVLFCLFLVFASRPADTRRADRVLAFFVVALAPVALYAVAQSVGHDLIPWITGENRSASTIGQPVLLAAVLGMGVPPLLGLIIRSRGGRRAGWVALLAVILAGIGAALSRGPLLGLACSLVVFTLLAAPRGTLRARGRTLALAGVALVLVLLAASLFGGASRVARRLGSLPEVGQRLVFFENAARIIADNPVDGVGLGNFSVVYPRYRLPEDNRHGRDQLPTMVHNGYLQAAVSAGVPSLVLYLGLVGVVLAGVARAAATAAGPERIVPAAIAAALSGYLVQDLTGWFDVGLTPFFWVFLGLGASLLPEPEARRVLPAGLRAPVLAAVALAGLPLLAHSWRLIGVDRLFFEAGQFERDTGREQIESRVRAGLARVPEDPHYTDVAATLYSEMYDKTGDPALYRQAADLLRRSSELNPHDPHALVTRIRLETLALRSGAADVEPAEVSRALERAPAMDPNNPSGHVAVAEYRVARGDRAAAVPLLEKAATLVPPDARETNLLADSYRALGRYDDAERLFRSALAIGGRLANPTASDHDDWVAASYGLAMTFVAKRQHRSALGIVAEVLKRFPERAYSHKVQAAIYQAMGDTDNARAALERYREGSAGAQR